MPMDYDVIVAGAGPGGATAAYELARQGVRVGVFEKHPLPRPKPCGGCLSLKIDRILAPDFHALVERTIYGARLTFQGLPPIYRRSDCPVAYTVMRDRFDAFLAAKARQAGAEVHAHDAVRAVREHGESVEVETERRTYRARFLVGADGAMGIVAREVGLQPGKRIAVALEGEITVPTTSLEAMGDEVCIAFGAIPHGYGWVFPKRDHLSVGVGGLKDRMQHPRGYYEAYLEDEGLRAALEREERRGCIIPVFDGGHAPRQTAHTLLVGDAAALVDSFLGEGIYYAIRSGQLAAATLWRVLRGEGTLAAYETRLAVEICPALRAAHKIGAVLYAFPETGYHVLTGQPHITDIYFDVLRGARSYEEMWQVLKGAAARHVLDTVWPFGTSEDDPVRETR